tara:strand:- start:25658 stop:26332 length:675 start_codon:yes stop_codon:yes gene_type:complete
MNKHASDFNDLPRKRSWLRRCCAFLWRVRPRFRLVDLIWLSLLSAVLIAWYRDHRSLQSQLSTQNGSSGISWSIDQILGRPNTPTAGDHATAWTTRIQDAGVQWFIVEFPVAVDAAKIEIVETYNPGAVSKVCSVSMSGDETEIWQGKDPVKPVAGMGRSIIVPDKKVRTRRIKVYLKTQSVPGWNEIDAVALHGTDGKIQWATNAWASDSYGTNREPPFLFWP